MTERFLSGPASGGPRDIHVRILATSDLHAHIHAYDYCSDRLSDAVGLSRTASLIGQMRHQADVSVLLDNGDFLLGSALGDHGSDDPTARVHPSIAAMNVLGYDAATLGNHEFNRGLTYLRAVLAQAAFPVVSANALAATGPERAQPLVQPYALIDREVTTAAGIRRRLRIGVIGFLPPQTALWDAHLLKNEVETADILEAARLWLPRLRAAGADVVVALSHSGIGPPDVARGAEDASTALAALPGIDAIVTGHAHLVFPSDSFLDMPGVDAGNGTLSGKPAVMPGANGSHLGVIDLWLGLGDDGWMVTRALSAVHPILRRAAGGGLIALAPDRADVIAATADAHAATLALMREVIGQTPVPLTSHFAMVSDTPALRFVAAAQADRVRQVTRGTDLAHLPILSAVAPFRTGGRGGPESFTDIPPGPLARRHVDDLYAFPNRLCAVILEAWHLAEWLERSASAYRQVMPEQCDQPLLHAGFPGYNFDTIVGLSYTIDLAAPPRYSPRGALIDRGARRIRELCHQEQPLQDDSRFMVVTNSYRLSTWDDAVYGRSVEVPLPGFTVRDVLTDWIAAGNTPEAPTSRSWKLLLPPAASVTFDTGPTADPAELAGSGLIAQSLGMTAEGFQRFRLAAQGDENTRREGAFSPEKPKD